MLKSAAFTRPAVGRVPLLADRLSRRPRAIPPEIRIAVHDFSLSERLLTIEKLLDYNADTLLCLLARFDFNHSAWNCPEKPGEAGLTSEWFRDVGGDLFTLVLCNRGIDNGPAIQTFPRVTAQKVIGESLPHHQTFAFWTVHD
jgi:hypothetical protein